MRRAADRRRPGFVSRGSRRQVIGRSARGRFRAPTTAAPTPTTVTTATADTRRWSRLRAKPSAPARSGIDSTPRCEPIASSATARFMIAAAGERAATGHGRRHEQGGTQPARAESNSRRPRSLGARPDRENVTATTNPGSGRARFRLTQITTSGCRAAKTPYLGLRRRPTSTPPIRAKPVTCKTGAPGGPCWCTLSLNPPMKAPPCTMTVMSGGTVT